MSEPEELVEQTAAPPGRDDDAVETDQALKKKKRRRFVFWSVVGLAALTLITGNYGAYQIYKLDREKVALEKEIERLKAEQEQLIRNRDRLKTDLSAIEKIAREKYSMVREGEQVYQVIPKEKKTQ